MPTYGKKLVLLGETSVGKTSIALRLVKDKFNENSESTIGAAFNKITIDKMPIDIWDTAGQERYLALTPMYYRGADVVLLVFDSINLESINRLEYYLKKLINIDMGKFECIIIGTKKDLITSSQNNENLNLIKEKFEKYNDMLTCVFHYITISSKTGENIDELKSIILEACGEYNTEKFDLNMNTNTNTNINLNEQWYYSDYTPSCNC
jgi:small GTP-binding protein